MFLKQVWGKNGVTDASLVLQAEKDKALGRPWPLPRDDAPGGAHSLPVWELS